MSRLSALPLLAALIALAACQTDHWGTGETVGTLGGAAAGGLVGSQFGKGSGQLATTGLGVIGGAWAGNEIGASIDKSSNRAAESPKGQEVIWDGPDNQNNGLIVPVHDGYNKSGAY